MSKIIDGLNRGFKPSKKSIDPIQEELANTFFTPPSHRRKKEKNAAKAPWVITAFSLLIALVVIVSHSTIDVKITLTRKSPDQINRETDARKPTLPAGATPLLAGGIPNTNLIKELQFSGDASKYSRLRDDMAILVNSKGQGWGNLALEFKSPFNMKKYDITYSAKGQLGNENMAVILTDGKKRRYRIENYTDSRLTKDWGVYTIDTEAAKGVIDTKNVSSIKFEFGSLTTGNQPAATVLLKDIYFKKRRGALWL